jgi:hypothetical protein
MMLYFMLSSVDSSTLLRSQGFRAAVLCYFTFTVVTHAVRLNQVQVLGTHNSFHIAPSNELQAVRTCASSASSEQFGALVTSVSSPIETVLSLESHASTHERISSSHKVFLVQTWCASLTWEVLSVQSCYIIQLQLQIDVCTVASHLVFQGCWRQGGSII